MRFVVKIVLDEVQDPIVWRKIAIPVALTFHQLHTILQAAMGWYNSHLYSFSEHGMQDTLLITSPHDEEYGIDARTVPIEKILFSILNDNAFAPQQKSLVYIYDYGDHWVHHLFVEDILREEGKKAELLDGAGACPPEDCGGNTGFLDLKQSIRTGMPSQIHGDSYLPWLEALGYKKYDPDVFDIKKAAGRLHKLKL